jgi:hypothetical protein
MTSNRLLSGLIVVAAAIALTGCGGGTPSGGAKAGGTKTMSADAKDAAYRSAVEAQEGHPVADWTKYKAVGADFCDDDESQFGTDLAVMTDDGNLEQFKTIVRHQCPDRMPEISNAQKDLSDFVAREQAACALPEAERTKEQSLLAEANGC